MKSLLWMVVLSFCSLAQAQNILSGTVTASGKPLESAIVQLPGLHLETQTDAQGNFTFKSIPKGTHKIVFSFVGFETQTQSISVGTTAVTVNCELKESIHQMDEVIVSTAFNRLQSENVMKVEHQTTKDLRQKGAATLIEGLATIPGVSQVSTGTSIGKPVIRGLSGNRVLVYNQGVRLENQQFGEEHGLGLNDAGIESVEVIKGPASLLYGSDALGGVLYFNPEKFAPANQMHLNFGQRYFTNTLGSNSTLGYKLSGDHLKFTTRVSQNLHSDYQTGTGDRVTNTRYKELDFKTGLGYSNAFMNTVFRYNYNRLNLGIPEEGIAEQTTTKNPEFPRQKVIGQILSWNTIYYLGKSKLETDFGYIDNDRSELEDSEIPVLHMKLKTFNYNVRYHLPAFGKLETIVGTQGMYQTNTNSGEEYLIPDATTRDFGVFATSNYQWEKSALQAGLRWDRRGVQSEEHGTPGDEGYFQAIDRSFNSFNASLGYKANIKENVVVRLNVASGFRAPNLAELSSNGVHEGSNRYEIGNANLKNEQNLQTDVNVEYRNPHFELFANGFYNHLNNYIYIAPNGTQIDGYDVFDYVQNNAYLFGGEAGIHFHPHPIDWLHVLATFESVTGKKSNGDYLPLIPANKVTGTFRAELKDGKRWKESFASVNTEHIFAQNNPGVFETSTRDYTLVNLAFGTKLTLGKSSFDLSLNANNLFDKTYVSHLSRLKVDGIPNMGRTIVLGLNYTL
ncbi:TonB-dependent receptor [Flavobacterium stagni]|uniref:TonB-dependent receptor n=1 Tax=Flavobacterium stagni TaxID=2506421 RepID=A0A4Q1KB43_9FLAO|nr:TonB-dependent receptor [Flavobacterium stagni]RXR24115.1 TonB-dependent receptor [Flavobacterium stagni]